MKQILLKTGFILGVFTFCLYSYLNVQNEMTQLKIDLPRIEKEISQIEEENRRLSYRVEQFESPSHLMELSHRPEYAHLRHPLMKEVITVPEVFVNNESYSP